MFDKSVAFYQSEDEVLKYIEARAGIDGAILTEKLSALLPAGASLLELGMGPGVDLALLSVRFNVTGSDSSRFFLEHFAARNSGFCLRQLDAVSIETDERFDCIFSNKVLHHLSRAELELSLARQKEVVKPGGLLFHGFWLGNDEIRTGGLWFNKYSRETITGLFAGTGRVAGSGVYSEFNLNDSLFIAVETS